MKIRLATLIALLVAGTSMAPALGQGDVSNAATGADNSDSGTDPERPPWTDDAAVPRTTYPGDRDRQWDREERRIPRDDSDVHSPYRYHHEYPDYATRVPSVPQPNEGPAAVTP